MNDNIIALIITSIIALTYAILDYLRDRKR
jgi:hypothetical protein